MTFGYMLDVGWVFFFSLGSFNIQKETMHFSITVISRKVPDRKAKGNQKEKIQTLLLKPFTDASASYFIELGFELEHLGTILRYIQATNG